MLEFINYWGVGDQKPVRNNTDYQSYLKIKTSFTNKCMQTAEPGLCVVG